LTTVYGGTTAVVLNVGEIYSFNE